MAGSGSSSVPGQLSLAFAAGAAAAVAELFVAWILDSMHIFWFLGSRLGEYLLDRSWIIYFHIVWGGVLGLLFLLPVFNNSIFKRGLVLGLVAAGFELLVAFPLFFHQGPLGLELGVWTPTFVVALSLLWGICAAVWFKMSGG
jgi:hypothetical protein